MFENIMKSFGKKATGLMILVVILNLVTWGSLIAIALWLLNVFGVI